MTVYDDIVLVVGVSLILVGLIWLLCYKLDKWLQIKETQARIRRIGREYMEKTVFRSSNCANRRGCEAAEKQCCVPYDCMYWLQEEIHA